ncbi:MAG: zinc dependent phospholipase C family protein [Otoolea sp.]|nr:zinc dependent phospholipase C family protein [Clostridiaceae bacterium]MDD6073228.1 zinc dependent phospholipase C family protein [Clostridium sp.]MDY5484705.1 zinc dependent phospholipase C family protein [Clostridium sp.]
MPGFTTHYIFGMKAYNDMPVNQLKHIVAKYRWLYQLGLQGPDMFFYNIPVLRHRDYRNVGSHMHEHQVHEFFECCLRHIGLITSRQQKEEAIAYFAGFLNHYIADSICHPFIYGRIGYSVKNPTSMHHGMHAALENDLDAILLWRYKKKKPSEFNQTASICLNGQEIQFISHFLASCINETYYPITYRNNFQVSPAMVHRSIWALRFGCRTLSDKSGKKKHSIELLESLVVKHPVASSKLVTDTISDYRKSCNLDHEVWCNPWNPSIASTASFVDLFRQTLSKCSNVYYLLNQAITSPVSLDKQDLHMLLSELGSNSYHSGLPVD